MSTRRGLIAAFALSTLLLAGCSWTSPSHVSDDLWGQVDAAEVDLVSKIPGYVDTLYVEEGARVTKGQVLAHVDARQLIAKEAEVQAQVHAAQAQALQAQAQLALAQTDWERVQKLYEAGAVSRQLYDGARTKYEVATEAYRQAEAGVAAYQHGVEQVAVNIDDTYLRAPMDGVVSTKYVHTGALVSSGMPIYSVQNTADNWVDVKVPETRLSLFSIGQRVELEGRDGTTRIVGTVTEISQKPDFATKRATSERGDATDIIAFNVRIRIHNAHLYPGMRFRVVGFPAS